MHGLRASDAKLKSDMLEHSVYISSPELPELLYKTPH